MLKTLSVRIRVCRKTNQRQVCYHHRRLQHLSFRCIFVNWKGIFIFWSLMIMTIKARITLIWNSSDQKSRLFTHYDESILCGSYNATMIKTTTTTTSFITLGLEKKALWANSFQILTLFYRKITRLAPSSWRPSCWESCLSQSSSQKSSTTAGWSESMAITTWGGSVQTPLVDLEVVSGAASWGAECTHVLCI